MGDIVGKIQDKMFGRIENPKELLLFKLGSALKMENTVLQMLGKLERQSQRRELKDQFSHHADETRGQIKNIEQAFGALGERPDEKPCLPIEAIDKEGTMNMKMTDEGLVDAVILSGAADTEHHEIAVYESLITLAGATGHEDIVGLLRENLEQEQHTLDEVRKATQKVAHEMAAHAV